MRSGVYRIRNTTNNHCYVGSAVNIDQRWRAHRHALRKHGKAPPKLQHAWDKYGESAFAFEVVEVCSREDTLVCEQFYIDLEKPYYNTRPMAHSNLGVRWSDEVNRKKHDRHRVHSVLGVTGCIKELAEHFAVVSYETAWTRVSRGMSVGDAVLTPIISKQQTGRNTARKHRSSGTHPREKEVTAFGVTAPLYKLVPLFSEMSVSSVRQRITRGATIEAALTEPKRTW